MGGVEVVVDQLARAISARGHEVTHLAATSLREDDQSPAAVPYEVVRIAASNVAERLAGVPFPLFAPRALRRALLQLVAAADVVHVHGMLYQNSAAALSLARRTKRPCTILTEHVGHVHYANPLLNVVQTAAIETVGRRSARAADAIVVLNPRVETLMRRLAHATTTVVRIDNGVDLVRYRPPLKGERESIRLALGWDERPRVLFVGRLVGKKGLPAALEAARLGGGQWELVVAGPGSPVRDAQHVRFLGSLPADEVARLYRASDVFLLPSRSEGFPLTAQEAMASGLPVVLGADAAYAPILEGCGRGAWLVEPSPLPIAEALGSLLPIASAAGKEASSFARARFDWGRTAERHLEVYEAARERRGRS
jgi:D-inositol-3-phosphate glycosyltransferase